MKVKTSITLPNDLLAQIDRAGGKRSVFLEQAARLYLGQIAKRRREARDAAILEKNVDRLNAEALDVLKYQNAAW